MDNDNKDTKLVWCLHYYRFLGCFPIKSDYKLIETHLFSYGYILGQALIQLRNRERYTGIIPYARLCGSML